MCQESFPPVETACVQATRAVAPHSGESEPATAKPADELKDWLLLSHTDGIGPIRCRALLQCFGPAPAVFAAGPAAVAELLQSAVLAASLFGHHAKRDAAVFNAMRWLRGGPGSGSTWHRSAPRSIIALGDPWYPPRLLDLADPPPLLYCVGDPHWLRRPQVAIVGSRNATALGADTAQALAEHLAAAGWMVTSGMAEGIDHAGHLGALAAGGAAGTVAVLGTGIDRVYPHRHRQLAREIAARGAVISEQAVGTPPLPANFPRRNRLIAALAHGVLVVEAATRSGSLITARLAADLGREVMAVPGSIHSPLARGCNALIRQGAKLVESADDILVELPALERLGAGVLPTAVVSLSLDETGATTVEGGAVAAEASGVTAEAGAVTATASAVVAAAERLSEAETALLSVMSADPVMPEALAARQRLPAAALLSALQTLELLGLVERQRDGAYIRRCTPAGTLA